MADSGNALLGLRLGGGAAVTNSPPGSIGGVQKYASQRSAGGTKGIVLPRIPSGMLRDAGPSCTATWTGKMGQIIGVRDERRCRNGKNTTKRAATPRSSKSCSDARPNLSETRASIGRKRIARGSSSRQVKTLSGALERGFSAAWTGGRCAARSPSWLFHKARGPPAEPRRLSAPARLPRVPPCSPRSVRTRR